MIKEATDKNVLNLDLSETARTKIWVNGDNRRVLELNLTDLGIMGRAKDAKDKLDELQAEANELASADVPATIESEEDEVTIRGIVKLLKGSEHQTYMEELFLNAYKKELTFVETTKDIPDFNK